MPTRSESRSLRWGAATLALSCVFALTFGAVVQSLRPHGFDVREYGARPDDGVDDSLAIRKAAAACLLAGGNGPIVLPAGVLDFTGAQVELPSNCAMIGQGRAATLLRTQAGRATPVVSVNGKTNVDLVGFSIIKATGAAAAPGAYGIYIRGDATDVNVERVSVDSMWRGVQIAGGEGTTPGTCRRIACVRVTSTNAPQQFGFNVDDADVVLFDNCHSNSNGLDGFKARKKATHLTLQNCTGMWNGTFVVADGFDGYAGADGLNLVNCYFANNTSNAVTLKTGDLTKTDAANFGYVRNANITNLRSEGHAAGYALYLTLNDPGDTLEPLASNVNVDGLRSDGDLTGVYINARNVRVNSATVRKSLQDAVVISSRAMDVEINDLMTIAAGQQAAGTYNGVLIAGASNVRINRPLFIGKDGDAVAVAGDYTPLTGYTKFGVQILSGSPIFITKPRGQYLTSNTVNDAAGATGGVVLVDQDRNQGIPSVNGAYGTHGSTLRLERSGTGEDGYDAEWVKTAGNRATPTGGWTRRIVGAAVTALPAADATREGAVLRLKGGAGVADTFHVCIQNAAGGYEWKQFTLQAAPFVVGFGGLFRRRVHPEGRMAA